MRADMPLRERTATDPASKVVWSEWDPTEAQHRLERMIRDEQDPGDYEHMYDPILSKGCSPDYYLHLPVTMSGTRLSITERLYLIREDFATEAKIKAWTVREHLDGGWRPICERQAYQQVPSFSIEETLVPIYVAPSRILVMNKAAPDLSAILVPQKLMGKGKAQRHSNSWDVKRMIRDFKIRLH